MNLSDLSARQLRQAATIKEQIKNLRKELKAYWTKCRTAKKKQFDEVPHAVGISGQTNVNQ